MVPPPHPREVQSLAQSRAAGWVIVIVLLGCAFSGAVYLTIHTPAPSLEERVRKLETCSPCPAVRP